jgi:hypothetical protein
MAKKLLKEWRFEKVSDKGYKENRDLEIPRHASNQPTLTARGWDEDDKDISTRSDRKMWKKENKQSGRWHGRLDIPLSPYAKKRIAYYEKENALAGLRHLTDEQINELEEDRKKKITAKPKKRKASKKKKGCGCK